MVQVFTFFLFGFFIFCYKSWQLFSFQNVMLNSWKTSNFALTCVKLHCTMLPYCSFSFAQGGITLTVGKTHGMCQLSFLWIKQGKERMVLKLVFWTLIVHVIWNRLGQLPIRFPDRDHQCPKVQCLGWVNVMACWFCILWLFFPIRQYVSERKR